jgi:starch phosphorylase
VSGDADIDQAEAEQLYSMIESSIAPEFYDRDIHGIPRSWVARMRRSMARLTPAYSSNRMVQDYVDRAYLPAVAQQRYRTANDGQVAKTMQLWAERLQRFWSHLHIGETTVSTTDQNCSFSTAVYFGDMATEDVQVELYADHRDDGTPEIHRMKRGKPIVGSGNGYIYDIQIAQSRSADDYTVRIIPWFEGVSVPTEIAFILWQK